MVTRQREIQRLVGSSARSIVKVQSRTSQVSSKVSRQRFCLRISQFSNSVDILRFRSQGNRASRNFLERLPYLLRASGARLGADVCPCMYGHIYALIHVHICMHLGALLDGLQKLFYTQGHLQDPFRFHILLSLAVHYIPFTQCLPDAHFGTIAMVGSYLLTVTELQGQSLVVFL